MHNDEYLKQVSSHQSTIHIVPIVNHLVLVHYSRTSIIRTYIIRNLDYPALKIVCFNDIHCNLAVRHLEYLLQVYIEL